MDSSYCHCPFISFWRNPFGISCSDMSVSDVLNFVFIWECLNSLFLKAIFATYRILVYSSFFFSTLNMSFYCLLAFMGFDEKSAMLILLRICTWVTPFALISRFCLSLTSHSLATVCLGVDLFHFNLLGVCSAFWMRILFIKFEMLLATIYSKIFSVFFLLPLLGFLLCFCWYIWCVVWLYNLNLKFHRSFLFPV